MESQLKRDRGLSAHLGNTLGGFNGKLEGSAATKTAVKMEEEQVARAQEIVSQFQIADLNKVIDLVTKYSFEDEQHPYLLVIDDLDKNWMPDDDLYLELLKSLLLTVRELNYRLKNAKIIVALREDIYQRVYQQTSKQQAQREKWADVQVRVRWAKDQLVDLVNRRLAEVFRGQYTKEAPTLDLVLPARRRRPNEEDPLDYVIERTLLRPRDIIDFLNRCFSESKEISRLTWSDLTAAEIGYSENRLQAMRDEWISGYFGLPLTFSLLRRLGPKFTPADIADDDLMDIFLEDETSECQWLVSAMMLYSHGGDGILQAKKKVLEAWFNVGLVGLKDPISHRTILSLDRAFHPSKDAEPAQVYIVLKIVRSALGINPKVQQTT